MPFSLTAGKKVVVKMINLDTGNEWMLSRGVCLEKKLAFLQSA